MPDRVDKSDNDLLTTALEKLLYLESRLEAAEASREAAEREAARQRAMLQQARQALLDWQRRAASAESAAEGAERELARMRSRAAAAEYRSPDVSPSIDSDGEDDLRQRLAEAEDRLALFARERESWLDRMAAMEQLRSASGEGTEDVLDLGSFIAELRAEMLALRKGRPLIAASGPVRPDLKKLVEEAPRVEHDPEELLQRVRLSRAERTLASLCATDLKSPSPTIRRRAAERLREAGIGALNPLVVDVLGKETDAGVRSALVALLDDTGGPNAELALRRLVDDGDVRVRARVVEGLGKRGLVMAATSPALRDPAPAVRRRALVQLKADDPHSIDALTDALSDDDASVRRTAALVLASRSDPEARAVLEVAAHSGDEEVASIAREFLFRRPVGGSPNGSADPAQER